ncbi:DUF6283 family protein [Streptomyces galilaeus]|uniref:DUF6283 family protein n=1 Tax=Streptomyces galilaeus TaxID=33899 RepID=UPI0038F6507F
MFVYEASNGRVRPQAESRTTGPEGRTSSRRGRPPRPPRPGFQERPGQRCRPRRAPLRLLPPGPTYRQESGRRPTTTSSPSTTTPSWTQPARLFLCHQHDAGDDRARVCRGDHLLALRTALVVGDISVEPAETIRSCTSPVPLFTSGAEAAAHATRDIHAPGTDARRAIDKITRSRTDLT